MTDLFAQGAAWLEEQRHQHLTRTVTYERGADSVELAATVGRTEFEQADEYGTIRRTESRDFLVRTQDLVLANVQVLPKAGDRVRESDGDVTFIYEVMAPGSEPPYRYSDHNLAEQVLVGDVLGGLAISSACDDLAPKSLDLVGRHVAELVVEGVAGFELLAVDE